VILFNSGHDSRNKRLDLARAAVGLTGGMLPGVELKVLDGSIEPTQVPLWMKAADCLLVTSDAEGSPTVVQEAMASNLPIVSVDAGDVAERLEGVRQTRIVRRDPLALGAALVDVLKNPERSDGSLRAESLSLTSIAGALMALYGEVLRTRSSALNAS